MKWYRERLGELAAAEPVYSVCGDDCAVCPRYVASTAEELGETAEFWFRAGWRDHVLPPEEMRCGGCGSRGKCSYMLLPCTREHGAAACAQCPDFVCDKVKKMYENSAEKKRACREACETEEEFAMLCRAFYEKEKNMARGK